jgi:hypothetical protein
LRSSIYYRDHAPPHFHALYGDFEITVSLRDGAIQGEFPRRAQALVLEWFEQHRAELLTDWERAQAGEALLAIPPLD